LNDINLLQASEAEGKRPWQEATTENIGDAREYIGRMKKADIDQQKKPVTDKRCTKTRDRGPVNPYTS